MKTLYGSVLMLGAMSWVGAVTAAEEMLEEIVVTAQKRSENLQDVPIAISAVTGDKLASLGANNITALAEVTPGLQMSSSQGLLAPRIRGVGSNLANVENSVAIYVDGVYLASASGALLSLNNLAQIETLKGPQGTLFGRNATGGALLVQTLEPTHELSSRFDVGYGNYNTSTVNGYIAGGVASTLDADFAVHVSHQGEGYGKNLFTGADVYRTDLDLAARSKWVWKPTDNDTVHFIADFARREGSSATSNNVPAGTYPSSLVQATPSPTGPYNINSDVNPTDKLTAGGVSARVDHDMSWARLTSITAYRQQQFQSRFDIDLTPNCCLHVPVPFPPFTLTVQLPIVSPYSRDRQISQELQLLSPDTGGSNRLTWVMGLYYFHDLEEEINSFSQVATRSYSGFGETHIEFLPATHLTVGLRYTDEEKALSTSSQYAGPPITDPASKWFSQVTYRAGLDHKFDNGTLIYVSKNLGFKSGGYNGTQPSLPNFKPEKLNSYEAGIKSEFLDRKVRLNGAAFYYDYTDIQMIKLTSNQQLQFYNGPSAVVYGADLDLEARLTQGLTLSLGASYIHDRFTADSPLVQFNKPNPGPIPGGSTADFESAKGNRLPSTPDWTANVGLNYVLPTSVGNWTFDASYLHNDGWFGEPDNQLRQPAYNITNASVYWHVQDGRYTIGLWGRNLSDERVYTFVNGNTISGISQYAPPRTYGIKLSANF
jgi:iron complex outermembrane receptor protein